MNTADILIIMVIALLLCRAVYQSFSKKERTKSGCCGGASCGCCRGGCRKTAEHL